MAAKGKAGLTAAEEEQVIKASPEPCVEVKAFPSIKSTLYDIVHDCFQWLRVGARARV